MTACMDTHLDGAPFRSFVSACLPAVVVTPLLSLMQDQVQALNGLACGGVPTSYLSSQQTVTESRVGGCRCRWLGW